MSICFAIADADLELTKDIFSMAGTVVAAIGVLIAGWVGYSGLATWKRQMKGQANHDLSRKMLVELYRFRADFNKFRRPAIYPHEVNMEGDPRFPPTEQGLFERIELGFSRRISSLNSAHAEIEASLLHAQALWGDELAAAAKGLDFLKDEYEEYVRLRLLCSDPSEPDDEQFDHMADLDMRRNAFKNRLDISDPFGDDLERAIKEFERILKSKLK